MDSLLPARQAEPFSFAAGLVAPDRLRRHSRAPRNRDTADVLPFWVGNKQVFSDAS